MAKYLAYQIILHKLMYNNVIARFPKYKEDIDKVLDDMGWMNWQKKLQMRCKAGEKTKQLWV